MTTPADRIELIELTGRYADIADLKDFSSLPALVCTDSVTLDFSSLSGLPPMTVPLDEYVHVLGQAFAPFPATHHTITGHVVEIDGDRATRGAVSCSSSAAVAGEGSLSPLCTAVGLFGKRRSTATRSPCGRARNAANARGTGGVCIAARFCRMRWSVPRTASGSSASATGPPAACTACPSGTLTSQFPVPSTAPQHPEPWNPAPSRGGTQVFGLRRLSPRHENGPPTPSADRQERLRL